MKITLLLFILSLTTIAAHAQTSYYTLLQGGTNIGVANKGYKGTFSGYSASIVIGKNFNDRAYLGIGIGNERLKGSYDKEISHSSDGSIGKANYIQDLFPLFVDGRLPIASFSSMSKIGLLANGGYAPRIGARYDRGILFRGGLFYLHENISKFDWIVSAAYGYQELANNLIDIGKHIQHQQFNISVGIVLK